MATERLKMMIKEWTFMQNYSKDDNDNDDKYNVVNQPSFAIDIAVAQQSKSVSVSTLTKSKCDRSDKCRKIKYHTFFTGFLH